MNLKIKTIKDTPDFNKISDLIISSWAKEFKNIPDEDKIKEYKESHNKETDTLKFLYDGDCIIGFSRYTIFRMEDENIDAAHTLGIAVCSDYKRKGLGRLLLQDMIDDSRKKGFTKLLSRSFKSNAVSIKLHQSLGFKQYLETEDSIVWEI